MFSSNQKISIRQIRRLLVLDLFGLSSLMLPGILAKGTGPDGIFSIVLTILVGMIYVWILGRVLNRIEQDYYGFMKKQVGQIISDILMIFYLFYFIFLSAFVLYKLAGLIRTWLLPDSAYGWVCLVLLLLAAYAAVRGIEGRARVYEIIFWFLGIPLLVMLALAIREVNVNYWTPVFHTEFFDFEQGILSVSTFILPIFLILFLKSHCSKPQKLCHCAARVLGMVGFLNILIYMILLGTFQDKTTSVLEWPVITLMSMVKFPGGFVARMDAFMISIWFFSLFALMNTCVFYSGHIVRQIFGENEKKNYSLCAVLVLSLIVALWFFRYPDAESVYEIYTKYVALPFILLVPIILLFISNIKNLTNKKEEPEYETHQ